MNFEAILDILFPPECLACQKAIATGTLCAACRGTIGGMPAIAIKSMEIGKLELARSGNDEADDDDGTAYANSSGRCYFLGAAGHYENHVLKSLIHALKFGGIRGAAAPLAEILAFRARRIALPLKTFTVVPVPLSKLRMRERGFNQSTLIAERFARLLELPFAKDMLVRTQHRKPQSTTRSLAERRENIRGCFALGGHHGDSVGAPAAGHVRAETKNIILVDDVSTSGSTFVEAARVLADGGAAIILALAVAKA